MRCAETPFELEICSETGAIFTGRLSWFLIEFPHLYTPPFSLVLLPPTVNHCGL